MNSDELAGVLDMALQRQVALLARHPDQQVDEAQRVDVVALAPAGTGGDFSHAADDGLDGADLVADQQRHRA